jgi:hypothetical protein
MICAFSLPYVIQNYYYLVYFDLASYTPTISLLISNFPIITLVLFFLWKNGEKNLDTVLKKAKENQKEVELLSVSNS